MLVVRWFEVLAQLVGSEEKLRLKTEIGTVTVGLLRLGCKFAGNSDPLRGIFASNSDPF
jgi:hypothetical protein